MSSAKRRQILEIVASDSTFGRRALRGGGEAHVGKCLHCNATLTIALDGEPLGDATIEHILPRNQGGTDALSNLALACARCNHEKGIRHDSRRKPSSRALEVVSALQEKRAARWRSPDEAGGDDE